MSEMITISKDELDHLQKRTNKCSMDKSYLQLVVRLMNRVSAASGLEDTVDCMLRNIVDVVGGANIILYYWIDSDIFYADVYGRKTKLPAIDDDQVQRVVATREPIEVEQPFSDTLMQTPEFTNAYTWVYPLLVGSDLVGVFKMESLHIGMRELYQYLPTFFSFVALALKNEVLGYTRLQQAYDRLNAANADLNREIAERGRAEEGLRTAKAELEERVAERTAELQRTNERLQQELAERGRAQEKEHLLSAIVQTSDEAIIAKDLDGVILSWNRGAELIYGYSAEEAIGRKVSMLVPPDHPDELATIMTQLSRGERIEHFTTERIRKDGQRITISLTVSPILNGTKTIVGASSIAHDITGQIHSDEEIIRLNRELEERVEARTNDLEAKRIELENSQRALLNIVEDLNLKTSELEDANARLQELERLKSMFIASMSHELRTPLNSIIGFSSILHDEWLGPVNQEQKENLATILRSGKHLLTLINDVIDVSKIEAGKIDVHLEEFDLYDLMQEAAQLIEKDLREKGLELHLELQHDTVCTDRRRLLQCIINLLSNALKFTQRGGVTVETSREIGAAARPEEMPVRIVVRDTGIGIPAEDIPRLFQPFVRLDSPIKTIVPGTGLGLYLTHKLVGEVLHGDILCTSHVGKGSSFTIRIPERIHEKGTGNRG